MLDDPLLEPLPEEYLLPELLPYEELRPLLPELLPYEEELRLLPPLPYEEELRLLPPLLNEELLRLPPELLELPEEYLPPNDKSILPNTRATAATAANHFLISISSWVE